MENKKKNILSGKSFLISIITCLVAIGIATAFAVGNTINDIEQNSLMKANEQSQEPWLEQEETWEVVKPKTDVEKSQDTQPSQSSQSQAQETLETEQDNRSSQQSLSVQYSMPIKGDTVNAYSNYELVYNETLKAWQTHNGVDIAGNLGDEVKACADGTVKEITNDDLWGVCVIIEHPDGIESHYNGLEKTVLVKKGDKVKAGQAIGGVGDTAGVETLEKPHLHFALKCKDVWIDPFTMIKR